MHRRRELPAWFSLALGIALGVLLIWLTYTPIDRDATRRIFAPQPTATLVRPTAAP